MPRPPSPPGWHLWAYLLALSAMWGGAFPLMRFAVQSMPPLALSGMRAGVATAALALFVWLTGRGLRPGPRMLRDMVVLGSINGWVPTVLTAASLGRITSAQGSLIQASGPLMVACLAALVLREEPLTARRLAGIGVGFLGIAAIFAPLAVSGEGSLAGGLLMLAAAACYAAGTVYVRWARPGASPVLALGQQLFSFLPAILLAAALHPVSVLAQPWPVWAAVAVLGVFASAVPFTLFLRMLRTASAGDAALIGYLQPVWAIGLAAALLGEWPEPRVLLGGAVVLGGVWLASRPVTPPAPPGAGGSPPRA